MRILILGGSGLLGQKLLERSCNLGYMTIATYNDKSSLNYLKKFPSKNIKFSISNNEKLKYLIDTFQPTHILNCLSIGNIGSQGETELRKIFSEIPKNLSKLSKKYNIKIINISSDAVFDSSSRLYDENCKASSSNFYGKCKFLGEISDENIVNVRCSMYGIDEVHERGLFNWFLKEDKPILYRGYYFSGLSTIILSNCIMEVAKDFSKYPNIIHIAGTVIQKSDLIVEFNEIGKLEKYYSFEDRPIQNFGLDGSLFLKISGMKLPSHTIQIKELVSASGKIQKIIKR